MEKALGFHRWIRKRIAKVKISQAAAREQLRIRRARHQLCAGQCFENGESAGVIQVRMTIKKDLDLPQAKAELLQVCFDLRKRFLITAVQENVSFRRRDQERGHFRRTDVINIPNQAVRLDRLIP